jgi:succinoglycan biosynthesis transport protein ExoP
MYDNQLRPGSGPAQSFNAADADDDDVIDIRALALTIWRRKWVVVNVTTFFTVLALLILIQMTPRYTASGMMAIESRQSSVVDLEAVLSGMSTDVAAIKTEIDVLKSRRLAGKLVDQLGLVNDPEFNGSLNTEPGISHYLNPLTYVSQAWRDAILGRKVDTRSAEEIAIAERSRVIDSVLAKLAITNPARSYSMQLSFESADPKKAARMVNTLADLYLTDQLEVKFEATQRANDWLNGRVSDLRENVRTAEQAAQNYREQNQLIQTAMAGTVAEQQLAQINSQLIDARTDLGRAQARQEQVGSLTEGQSTNNLLEVLNSQLIQRLREQQAEVQRSRAELATRYGPKHPKMINVEAEIADVASKIELETGRIVAGIASEAEIAAIRVRTLEENLNTLKAENFEASRAQVRLRELEREAEASRVLLETFLARFKETTSQEGLQQADARIISQADVPTGASFPKKKLTLVLVMFASAGLSVGLIFLLESLDNGFRTFDQVQSLIKLRGLGMIPLIGKNKLKELRPEQYLNERPTSSFAEAHRNVHASLMFSGLESQEKKVLTITSSVPGEGKSTASLCMGQIMGRTGLKVLIVEADLRRPVLRHRLGIDPRRYASLNDVLEPAEGVETGLEIYTDPNSGVQFLWGDKHQDPQRLFTSKEFAGFITDARARYDLVLIDTPPVMAVSDVMVISKQTDALVFAIQWEKTPRTIVKAAIEQLRHTSTNIAGVVLTQVDVRRHQGYGYGDQGYYYGTKSGYYTN